MLTVLVICNLHAYLHTQGVTYAQLAQAVGVPEAAIQRMFASNNCKAQMLLDICDLLQIELANLFNDRPKKRAMLKVKHNPIA